MDNESKRDSSPSQDHKNKRFLASELYDEDYETRVAAAALLAVAEISPSSVMDVRSALDSKDQDEATSGSAAQASRRDSSNSDEDRKPSARKRQRTSSPPRSLQQPSLQRKSVRFDLEPETSKIKTNIISQAPGSFAATASDLWISKKVLRAAIRKTDVIVDDLKRNNLPYFQTMLGLFQKCSKPSPNLPELLTQYRETFTNPPEEVRGLERHLHKMLSQYKTFHVRNVLKHQKTKEGEAQPPTTLRNIALKTSRLSRSWGILLGQGDSMWVAQMVRRELEDQQRRRREERQRERAARLPPPPDADIIEIVDSSDSNS